MKIRKRIFLAAFLITSFLLLTIVLIGTKMDSERKVYVSDQMTHVNQQTDVQTYFLLSEMYGQKFACIAFKQKLSEWDQTLWDLGIRLENYRVASEEFQKDKFYLDQKKLFNENEALYMAFLTKVKNECELNTTIISFFYVNSADCKKCDDQSFVLTDLKRELKDEVSIFSYDLDLEVPTVSLLAQFYEINEYPCVVINEQKYCGIQDKEFIIEKMCDTNTNLSFCPITDIQDEIAENQTLVIEKGDINENTSQ